MVVVYRKVNSEVVFDSYPIPTIEQFGSMVVLSVLHIYYVYYQIPLSFPKSSSDCLLQAIWSFLI